MKTSNILLLILLITLTYTGFSQVKVTSYSIYALGISAPIKEKFNAEIKVFTNQRHIVDTSVEINGKWRFKTGEFHQFSTGIGFGLIPGSGNDAYVAVPVDLEIFPLQSFRRLSLVFELSPDLYFNDDNISLGYLWGIRYSFEKHKN